jgi:uncharacterized membrane protein YbaN (DUF454 family)
MKYAVAYDDPFSIRCLLTEKICNHFQDNRQATLKKKDTACVKCMISWCYIWWYVELPLHFISLEEVSRFEQNITSWRVRSVIVLRY